MSCQPGNPLQPSASWRQHSPPHTPSQSRCAAPTAPPPEPYTSGAAPTHTHPGAGEERQRPAGGLPEWKTAPPRARCGPTCSGAAVPLRPSSQELLAQAQPPEAKRETQTSTVTAPSPLPPPSPLFFSPRLKYQPSPAPARPAQ